MFLFVKIAFLNIFKHAKRSVVVFLAVMIAVGIMVGVNAAMSSISGTLVTNILPSSGHIRINNADAKKAVNPFDARYLVPDADRLLSELTDPRIVRKEKILPFGALVMENQDLFDTSREVRNIGMQGIGIETDSLYYDNIRKGIVSGRFLENDGEMLVSTSIAKLLGFGHRDRVTVLVTDADGNPWYQEFALAGLFDTNIDQVDENIFIVTHKAAETMLNVPGKTREIRLSVADYEKAGETLAAVSGILGRYGAAGETWQETYGSLMVILRLFNVINVIVDTLFIIVATSVIINSIIMSVFERIREYGTLRAIGLKRKELFAMILTEGGLLGFFGAAAGTVAGMGEVLLFGKIGIEIGSVTESIGVASRFYPIINPPGIAFAFACGIVISLLASLYAARVCSRITVTESLAHV